MANWKELTTYYGVTGNTPTFTDYLGRSVTDSPQDITITGDITGDILPSQFQQDWNAGSFNWDYDNTHQFTVSNTGSFSATNATITSGISTDGVAALANASHSGSINGTNTWVNFTASNINDNNAFYNEGIMNGGYGHIAASHGFGRPIFLKQNSSTELTKRTSSPWRVAGFSASGQESTYPGASGGMDALSEQPNSFSPTWSGDVGNNAHNNTNGTPGFWMGYAPGSGDIGIGVRNEGMWIGSKTLSEVGAIGPQIGFRYYDENNWGPFITSSSDNTPNHKHDLRYLQGETNSNSHEAVAASFTFAANGIDGNVYLGPNNWEAQITDAAGHKWQVYNFFRSKPTSSTFKNALGGGGATDANLTGLIANTGDLNLDSAATNNAACTGQDYGDGFPGGKRLPIFSTAQIAKLEQAYSEGGEFHHQASAVLAQDNNIFTMSTADAGKNYTVKSGYAYPFFYENVAGGWIPGLQGGTDATIVQYAYESSSQTGNNKASDANWQTSADESTPKTLPTTGLGANEWLIAGRYFMIKTYNGDGDTSDTLNNGFVETHAHPNTHSTADGAAVAPSRLTFKFQNLFRMKYEDRSVANGTVRITKNATMKLSGALGNASADVGAANIIGDNQAIVSTVGTIGANVEVIKIGEGGSLTPIVEIVNTNTSGSSTGNAKMWLEASADMDDAFGLKLGGAVDLGSDTEAPVQAENTCLYYNTHYNMGTATAYSNDAFGNISVVDDLCNKFSTALGGLSATNNTVALQMDFAGGVETSASMLDTYFDIVTQGANIIHIPGASNGYSSGGGRDKIFIGFSD